MAWWIGVVHAAWLPAADAIAAARAAPGPWWVGVLHAPWQPNEDAIIAMLLTPVFCLLLTGWAPWIFTDFNAPPQQ
jgi:hypothetical protein